ncbi:subtilisin-like protease SBT4.15 [Neltuma alba]|uniref:subtilisin-like protease SBT4.15 n=1 Tax=Neltuma alba TaxID=207710 RepID=UPI0010A53F73|nr:subtilisin-like protease SBT4.15 [Prosopis alba]
MKLRDCTQLLFALCFLLILIQASSQDERKPYIVYMGHLPEEATRTNAVESQHYNLLEAAIGDHQLARESKIHSYSKSFNGFVAHLLPHEAEKLEEKEGVVSVFPNTVRKLHTTRSWDFLGMPLGVERRSNVESHIIVGMLDTGIWMDCPSFNDEGYGPPPRRWKGKCVTGVNFTGCNNKVIGAKYYNLGEGPYDANLSPVDDEGHGTHTAATVAGVPVAGASLYDLGKGTARGGVPSARIAVYKVCWSIGCSDMDILAGFDDAIADGVNFISVSVGGASREFFKDPIAIGAFHAMKMGILTSCSAGNDGPSPMTVENVAPWILTVAASITDRQFTTEVALGNGKKVTGLSINTFSPGKMMYPLTSGALASNNSREGFGNASACEYGTLSKEKVKGRIVYCLDGMGGQDYVIEELGGVGTIMDIPEPTDVSVTTLIPGTFVEAFSAGKAIELYINSTKNPRAAIFKTTTKRVPAPFLASFSSKGPHILSPNILKPDLAAPGVDILASYSKLTTITGYPEDMRHALFNILSGTSMSCPHVTAAAAYVKSFHPDWTPAAVKSALMTTATPLKIGRDKLAELGSGSGQINPTGALHPGLVYDIKIDSYVAFLCKRGYNNTVIGLLVGSKRVNCSTVKPPQGIDGINYPTMHISLATHNSSISAVFHRTVTNVGYGTSTYKAKVTAPRGLSVRVIPNKLQFTQLHQTKIFKVMLKGSPMPNEKLILSALLEWNDSKHNVRSPIIVYRPPFPPTTT